MDDDAPKRRSGRPALRAGESSVRVSVRLCTSDYDRACALARQNRVNVPQLLRTAFRMAVKQQRRLDEP